MKKYKTHEELDITFAEYGALFGVKAMIEAKVIRTKHPKMSTGAHVLDMSVACRTDAHCGSVGCLGGTMAMIMQTAQLAEHCSPASYVVQRECRGLLKQGRTVDGLSRLFYPVTDRGIDLVPKGGSRMRDNWDLITESQMLAAIENYLTTGQPKWQKVLKGWIEKPLGGDSENW